MKGIGSLAAKETLINHRFAQANMWQFLDFMMRSD
jgi:hypothetical protein